jgi:hypothetical protein
MDSFLHLFSEKSNRPRKPRKLEYKVDSLMTMNSSGYLVEYFQNAKLPSVGSTLDH